MNDPDAAPRLAAFERLRELVALFGGGVPWAELQKGFHHDGRQVLFASAAEGIFKPASFTTLLSIKTVVPKPRGGRIWYQDQKAGQVNLPANSEDFRYDFTGNDPESARNRWLRDAMELQIPIAYFYGIAPGMYEPIYPAFIVDWNSWSLSCTVSVTSVHSSVSEGESPASGERRYAMRQVRQRLHQAVFRERVLHAYGARCALSGLPEARLIDAAHIIPDGDAELGQPDVRNGICMSKVHHAAYDGGLIGIDPDYRIHVADRLFDLHDGPMLEFGLKALRGTTLRRPENRNSWPDRERLEARFSTYLRTA